MVVVRVAGRRWEGRLGWDGMGWDGMGALKSRTFTKG